MKTVQQEKQSTGREHVELVLFQPIQNMFKANKHTVIPR